MLQVQPPHLCHSAGISGARDRERACVISITRARSPLTPSCRTVSPGRVAWPRKPCGLRGKGFSATPSPCEASDGMWRGLRIGADQAGLGGTVIYINPHPRASAWNLRATQRRAERVDAERRRVANTGDEPGVKRVGGGVSLPVAIAFAYALSRPRFPGKAVDGYDRAPALSCRPCWWASCCCWRSEGAADREVAREHVRNPAGVHGRGRRAGDGGDGVPADGARGSGCRSRRPTGDCSKGGVCPARRTVDRFTTLALPLAWPGVLAGAVTAFAAGLGEFGAVITIRLQRSRRERPCRAAIYSALQSPGGQRALMR